MYTESCEIESSAKALQTSVEELDHQLVLFQTDLDTNDYMKESLDWDYLDVRKSLDFLLKQVKELAKDAETAVENEE